MKTTVELPDDLLIAAKQRAAEERRPLRALIEQGLRQVMARAHRAPTPRRMRWVTVSGGLGIDVSDRERMYERLRRPS